MSENGLIYCSDCGDVWANQGFEQLLYRGEALVLPTLYLWQNDNCVVIGRRQNAWVECDWQKLEADGGKLARRISGGGAVYHDPGNLNFTFVYPRSQYRQEAVNQLLLEAVRALGIDAELSGRNDMTAKGRKFSGQAFAFSQQAVLHHGTLLIDCDFGRLGEFLSPDQQKLQAKGIRSVRSRVVNLAELLPTLTVAQAKQALIHSFSAAYGGAVVQKVDTVAAVPLAYYRHFSSWEWRFGQAPPFEIQLGQRFDWGNMQLCLSQKNGVIRQARVFSDALDAQWVGQIEAALPGCAYRLDSITAALTAAAADTPERLSRVEQLCCWLAQEGI